MLTNDALSSHAIERLTINGYDGFAVDGNYQTPTSDQIPTLFDRSSGSGDTIGQSFFNPILALPGFGNGVLAPGATAALLVLQTDAQFYQLSTASVIEIASGKTIAEFEVGGEPDGVTTSPDGRFVYVTSEEDNRVSVIDTTANKVIKQFEVGPRPRDTAGGNVPDRSGRRGGGRGLLRGSRLAALDRRQTRRQHAAHAAALNRLLSSTN